MGSLCGAYISKKQSLQLENIYESKSEYVFSHSAMIQFKKKNFESDYKILQLKGKGASGQVYSVISKQGGAQRAAKIIKRKSQNQKLSQELYNEYNILKNLDHPNIIKVYEIYEQPKAFYIISQICQGGELFQKIITKKGFTQSHAAAYFYQILESLNYLHSHNIMHRDIKPENLLFSDNSEKAFLKLIDFGSAINYENSQLVQRRRVGTSYYIAPQVLNRKYNQKCDIWSCGVILYILLSGQPPFLGKKDQQILKNVQIGKISFSKSIWKKISEQAKDLILKLIQKDVDKRLQVKQALLHPWFKIRTQNNVSDIQLKQCLQNMKNFRSLKKIQEGVLIFIINFLTKGQQRDALVKMFKKFDLNGDGVISHQQLKLGYQKYYGIKSQKQILKILQAVDNNKSGFIDYTQFVIATMDRQISLCDDKIQKAFEILDEDKNGKLSIQQLKNMLGNNIPQEYYRELVKQFDTNGDGQISKSQFINMMKNVGIKKLKK